MKKIFCLALLAAAASLQAKTIEMPWYESINTNFLDVKAVELSDTATALTIHIRYSPGQWVRFAKQSSLWADGKQYPLRWARGIVPGEEFVMPESGEATVSLGFEPVPAETESITFSENVPSAWKIWGIDLTGTKADGQIPAGLPAELANPQGAPKTSEEIAETSLTFHFLGDPDALDDEYMAILNRCVGDQTAHKLIFDPKTMQTQPWTFTQFGPVELFVVHGNRSIHTGGKKIAPGERLDIYIDPSSSGVIARHLHRDAEDSDFPTLKGVYYNGQYAADEVDPEQMKLYKNKLKRLGDYDDSYLTYTLTPDQIVSEILKRYYKYKYAIDGFDAPKTVKDRLQKENAEMWLSDVEMLDNRMRSSYLDAHNISDWRAPIPEDSLPRLDSTHYLAIAKAFDLGSDKYDYLSASPAYNLAAEIDWEDIGVESPRLKAIRVADRLWTKAENGEIDDYDLQQIDGCGIPLFSQAIRQTNAETLDKLSKVDFSLARPMPDLPAEEAIKAITAEHLGKVVIIDVWNTWCQPCQHAIKINEPLKTGELADDDLVWIYIADDSSSKVAYYTQIPTIKGIHYRQTRDQYYALRNKYGIDGIPSYILVDRKGNISLRNDLRDHSKFIQTLREELDKK